MQNQKLFRLIKNKIVIKKNEKFSAIIGANPSSSARSPKLWNTAYYNLKKKTQMYPLDVDFKNLKRLLIALKDNKYFIGGSITTPYKVDSIKYLDGIDEKSKKIGSINTILKNKNKLLGTNTDFDGSLDTLKEFKSKRIKKILIIGCGGAGKATILSAVKQFRSCKFYFFNRDKKKLINFIKKINIKKYQILSDYKKLNEVKRIDLVINTTSIGFNSWLKNRSKYYNLKFFTPMSDLKKINKTISNKGSSFLDKNLVLLGENLLTTIRFFTNNPKAKVFDIIYNPKETPLIRVSKLFNNYAVNGDKMNLLQAVKAFIIVNKINDVNKIRKAMNLNE